MVIMDSLEAATALSNDSDLTLENFIEGNALLLKTTKEVFEQLQIKEINPINEVFDPELHQAMTTKDSDDEENTVLEVMQKGYKLQSKLLRPALVIVSKKK
jgi:molecular chaperone GrpE